MLNLTNHFLVSLPTEGSDIFSNSVVYVAEHNTVNGAVGVIINKPLGRTLKHAFSDVDFSVYHPTWSNNSLFLGGPVNGETGFVLHRTCNATGKLFDLTGDRGVLAQIATSEYKDNLFISAGYAVWDTLQIESEIRRNSWLVLNANTDLLFAIDPLERYKEAMTLLGIKNISNLYIGGEVFA